MITIIGALLPVFGVVLLGIVLKRIRFPGDGFWPYADRITYFVLFPVLLVEKLSVAELQRPELLPMTIILVAAIALVSLAVLIFNGLTDKPTFTSLLQGSIRPNTYVGFAGASALYGEEGLALAALAIASIIPLVNLISVGAFSWFLQKHNPNGLLRNIIRNPLILGCITGLLLNVTDFPLPVFFRDFMAMVGRAALPMGLLSVGAGLVMRSIPHEALPIVVSSLFKLALLPLLVLGICNFRGIEGVAVGVMVLYAALPCSVSSYTLAVQLGGNREAMAGIITLQTLLAMFTMPALLSWVDAFH